MQNTIQHPELLADIEAFLTGTAIGVTYFGKVAAGDSSLVLRLRNGGAVSPRVERRVREFMAARQQSAVLSGHPLDEVSSDASDPSPTPTPVLINGDRGHA